VLFAELETRVEQLKASEVYMKNLFYREKDAREVLEYDYKQGGPKIALLVDRLRVLCWLTG
jgi:hypothetical protein